MGLEAEAKAGADAVRKNWIFFLIVGLAVGIGVLWWDAKKGGSLTKTVAGLPIIGKLFA